MKRRIWLLFLLSIFVALSLPVLADGHTLPYTETFASFISGWTVGEDADGSSMYGADGGYELQIKTKDQTRRSVAPITVPDGYVAQVKLKVASGTGTYSLGFNYVDGTGYDFMVNPAQQQYRLESYRSGRYVEKLQDDRSGAIKRDDYNILKVAVVKSQAQLFVNDQLLATVKLGNSSDQMSLSVAAANWGNEPLTIHIESFSVVVADSLPETKDTGDKQHAGADNRSGSNDVGSKVDIASLGISMIRVPGAASFPIGTNDSGRCTDVDYPYYMAKTEVTYAQWKTVYDWAVNHGYTFANPGGRGGRYDSSTKKFNIYTTGHEDHPVTSVSWRDCMVWCNALTEYANAMAGTNYTCVYRYSGAVVRNSTSASACDNVEADSGSKGFRLPTSREWELAARYINGSRWVPGDYASGASDYTTGDVAWDDSNSGNSTQTVGTKEPNALGIDDLSGNVSEWCFDWFPGCIGSYRVNRGGSWYSYARDLKVGSTLSNLPSYAFSNLGFRPVRTP